MLKKVLKVLVVTGLTLAASFSAVTYGKQVVNGTKTAVKGETTATWVAGGVRNSATEVTEGKGTKVILLNPTAEQTIIFNTPVFYETVESTISQLETIRSKGYKDAYLILDSPGGSVFDGAKLLAYIKHSPMRIHTVCEGMCASMAAHLFEGGKTRYMTDKSVLMFHPASGGVRGTLEQMLSRINMIKLYVDRMDADAARRSGLNYNQFKNEVLTEKWVETVDALRLNLADKMTFISYERASPEILNLEMKLAEKNIIIPNELKQVGILVLESVKLTKGK